MPDDLPLDAAPPARPPRFLLRRLLAALAAMVIAAAGMLAPVEAVHSLTTVFLLAASPAALTVAIIYSRGSMRAFSIGAMFHFWMFLICSSNDNWDKFTGLSLPDDDQLKAAILMGAGIVFVLSGGLLAVGVRWFVGGGGRRATHPDGAAVELPPQQERRPFQFSLRSMFIVTTLTALVCGGLFAPQMPAVIGTITALVILVPMCLTVAIVHARGYRRTFCVGAIFPVSFVLLYLWNFGGIMAVAGMGGSDPPDDSARLTVAIGAACYIGFTMLSGLVAIGVRWLVESPRRAPHPHHVHWDLSKPHGQPAGDDGQFIAALSEQEETEATEAGRSPLFPPRPPAQ